MTQEQVANYLGVSTPAVNKWEKGVAYPDVTFLPVLALLLSGLSKQEKLEYEKKIVGLYERVAEGADVELRERAVFMLAAWYMKFGKYDRTQEMIDRLPDRNLLDKRDTQADLYLKQNKLTEAAALLERKLQEQIQNIQMILVKLTDVPVKEENYENASYIANVSQECVKLFSFSEQFACVAPLEVALGQKNIPESISLIEKMMNSMQVRWAYEDMVLYHHIAQTQDKDILQKLKSSGEQYKKVVKKQMLPPLLAELDNDSKYEFLRLDEKFQQIVKRYKAMVEEEQDCSGNK